MDLEMTGLDPDRDRIIEIATIITDAGLNIIEEGPVLAVKQSESVLNLMDEWNQRVHKGSGLVARVQSSDVSTAEAEQATLNLSSATLLRVAHRYAVTVSARIGVFCIVICLSSAPISTIGMWTSAQLRSWWLAGVPILWRGLRKKGPTERSMISENP